ncbi:MAG: hypothetical protein ACETWM_19015 [Candidatus Lokiarchaeia archaeon]
MPLAKVECCHLHPNWYVRFFSVLKASENVIYPHLFCGKYTFGLTLPI